MVKVYGSAQGFAPEKESVNVNRQLMVVAGIMGLALVVCCALVASADLKQKDVVMYGIGSGEEQEGDNAVLTAIETFKDQGEMVEKELADAFYVKEFEKAEKETEKQVEEVKDVIKEAQNEHKILKIFAEGADAPLA